jgi:hypothetical protein
MVDDHRWCRQILWQDHSQLCTHDHLRRFDVVFAADVQHDFHYDREYSSVAF